jgi:hypothetical protein
MINSKLMLKNDVQKAFKKINEIEEYSKFIDQKKWKNGNDNDKLECKRELFSYF